MGRGLISLRGRKGRSKTDRVHRDEGKKKGDFLGHFGREGSYPGGGGGGGGGVPISSRGGKKTRLSLGEARNRKERRQNLRGSKHTGGGGRRRSFSRVE